MKVSDVVSLAAVVVAFLALIRSWYADKRTADIAKRQTDLLQKQVELQDRLAQVEQSRESVRLQARLRAEIRRVGRSDYRLAIRNTGEVGARNVAVMLDNRPILTHGTILKGQPEITEVGPESEITYLLSITHSCAPPSQVLVTWEDDSGKTGRFATVLTL
jgi:hypothetical protein